MSDSDDDLPISELIKKRKAASAASSSSAVKVKPEAPKSAKKAEPKVAQQSSSRSNTQNKSAEFYDETEKGKLTQQFLKRWWYAMQWPKDEDIGVPPIGYEALDGFKGVFICTRVSDSVSDHLEIVNQSRFRPMHWEPFWI